MKEYIGTKIVQAEPAFRLDGKIYPKTSPYPKSLRLEDGYKVVYQDGYVSWSPKDVFEEAYRETSSMTRIDRILNGDKEALVNEIHDIVKWARALTAQDWQHITHDSDGGLRGVIRRCLTGPKTNTAAE